MPLLVMTGLLARARGIGMKTSATNTRNEDFLHAPEESAALRSSLRSHHCPVLAGADVWAMGQGQHYSQGGELWLCELRSLSAT